MILLVLGLFSAHAESVPVSSVEWIVEECGSVGEFHVDAIDAAGNATLSGTFQVVGDLPRESFRFRGGTTTFEARVTPGFFVQPGETLVASFAARDGAPGPALETCHVFFHSGFPTSLARREFDRHGQEVHSREALLSVLTAWRNRPIRVAFEHPVYLRAVGELPLAPDVSAFAVPPDAAHFDGLWKRATEGSFRDAVDAVRSLGNFAFGKQTANRLESLLDRDFPQEASDRGHLDRWREVVTDTMRYHHRQPDDWVSVQCAYEPWWDPSWMEP